MQLLIVQLLLSILKTEMAENNDMEVARVETPRSRGRPTKHATPQTENALKVTVEGLSALKCNPTSTSLGLHPTCCIVVPHRLLLTWRKQVLSKNEASYISMLNGSIVDMCILLLHTS